MVFLLNGFVQCATDLVFSSSFDKVRYSKMTDSHSPTGSVEKVEDWFQREDYRLFLSEEAALERARQSPDEALDILITYAENDKDNPRFWPKWRKWYITCFVSMLNVVTYAALPCCVSR